MSDTTQASILKKQSVLISGASSGIGAAIAKKFSDENFEVILLGRNKNRLTSVQNALSGPSHSLAFDLKNLKSNELQLKNILDHSPPLAVLVNNAGIYHRQSFIETSDEVWLEQFQVNLFSAVQLTRLVWPYFLKNKSGSIINISSTLGLKPVPLTSAYSAVKAAMNNWTIALAQEGGAYQIRANAICPGIIDTPIHEFHQFSAENKKNVSETIYSMQLLSQLGQATDIAEATYFLATQKSKWTTGSILNVDGGIYSK